MDLRAIACALDCGVVRSAKSIRSWRFNTQEKDYVDRRVRSRRFNFSGQGQNVAIARDLKDFALRTTPQSKRAGDRGADPWWPSPRSGTGALLRWRRRRSPVSAVERFDFFHQGHRRAGHDQADGRPATGCSPGGAKPGAGPARDRTGRRHAAICDQYRQGKGEAR